MKKESKLIKIDNQYIVVDDSDIKCDIDYCFDVEAKEVYKSKGNVPSNAYVTRVSHSTEPLEGVIQLNFSEMEELTKGYSVEKMAISHAEEVFKGLCGSCDKDECIEDYIEGFKAHEELVKDKLFTQLDLLIIRNKLVDMLPTGEISAFDLIKSVSDYMIWFDKHIQSLLPQTEWNIEFDEQGKIKTIK